ncbi:hypothetical protein HMPREF1555_00448 [Porphyromonas gingivalis F0570]|uniref:Uncharacterized protein n=1 Tax=Porphyromonas gingivalis F0570 TaxID=1227271 RepID=A0A0E2LT23_PORGN|nr:hypothetical protein HMPREF1555_00448 [Porphyromonas gingivalis F0570]
MARILILQKHKGESLVNEKKARTSLIHKGKESSKTLILHIKIDSKAHYALR